jgi:hypothetical protein
MNLLNLIDNVGLAPRPGMNDGKRTANELIQVKELFPPLQSNQFG